MVFSSLTFVVFFLPLTMILYFICRNSIWRNAVLLVFSLLFYAWGEPVWVFAMLFTVTINYITGRLMGVVENRSLQRVFMILGVGISLGFLFYFKYCGFVVDNVTALLGIKHGFEAPVLPIGISFYTFQVITYTVDVYRGKVEVQKNYARLLLYVSFFPQLIAGPIVNYSDIKDQLVKRSIEINDVFQGFMRFFIGFGKKVLIANTCGIITEKIHAVKELSFAGAWLLVIAYGIQVYFDFSGYSDMAIGIGRMFGFRFLENFNYPFIAKSVTEFWRRWHISLGSFFREYVYIPLGGNRVSNLRLLCNIMIVWFLTGVWHGASWNFIVWGLYYGVLLVLEKFVFLRIKEKMPAVLNILMTLLFVQISWALFYYTDLQDSMIHLGVMFGVIKRPLTDAVTIYYFKYYFVFILAGVLASIPWKRAVAQMVGEAFVSKHRVAIDNVAMVMKPIATTIIFLFSMSVLIGQSYNPFLYFRF